MGNLEVQHSCEGEMVSGLAPNASCVEVAGLGLTGILVAVGILVAFAVVAFLLWRRIRNRA